MKLLPFTKLDIEVESDEETVRDKLSQNVEKFWTNRKVWGEKTAFDGHLTKSGFVIRRNIKYQNSFIPILIGSFESSGTGTRIRVTARMFLFTNIFMMVWLGSALFASISAIFYHDSMAFVPLLMFILGWALMLGGFWFELPLTIAELKRIVD